jgi:hypothetical protein
MAAVVLGLGATGARAWDPPGTQEAVPSSDRTEPQEPVTTMPMPAADPAPTAQRAEAQPEPGAGSMEPAPSSQESRESTSHREWVESIWTSP